MKKVIIAILVFIALTTKVRTFDDGFTIFNTFDITEPIIATVNTTNVFSMVFSGMLKSNASLTVYDYNVINLTILSIEIDTDIAQVIFEVCIILFGALVLMLMLMLFNKQNDN